jgi:hypothetical protein
LYRINDFLSSNSLSIGIRIVIVVGDVDNVERNEIALYVGLSVAPRPGYWVGSINVLMGSLWRESAILIHSFIHRKRRF